MTRTHTIVAAGLAGVVALGLTVSSSTAAGTTASRATPRDGRLVYENIDTSQIETINPDGTARQPVTPPDDVSYEPRWSPDGSHIVYSRQVGDDARLVTILPDGTDMTQLTDDAAGYSDLGATYTPDGTAVLFSRCRPDPPGGCALYRVRADGTHRRAVTSYGARSQVDFDVDVSPDGRRLAFARFDHRGLQAQVWVSRADGSHAHPVTPPALEAGFPRWTPNGRHLLVADNVNHLGGSVVRIDPDGSHRTRLTHPVFPHSATFADPSPSGKRIAYSDDRAYPQIYGYDLRVMRRDGSGKHSITSDGRLFRVDWGTAPLMTDPMAARSSVAEAPARRGLRRGLQPFALPGAARQASPAGRGSRSLARLHHG